MSPDEIDKFAEKVAYELQGTCKFLTFVLEEYEQEGMEDNSQFCDKLDSLVFCCEKCDWWFEQSEMGEEEDTGGRWICVECSQE